MIAVLAALPPSASTACLHSVFTARPGIKTEIGCHTLLATGITAYLKNGNRLEIAKQMVAEAMSFLDEAKRSVRNLESGLRCPANPESMRGEILIADRPT